MLPRFLNSTPTRTLLLAASKVIKNTSELSEEEFVNFRGALFSLAGGDEAVQVEFLHKSWELVCIVAFKCHFQEVTCSYMHASMQRTPHSAKRCIIS